MKFSALQQNYWNRRSNSFRSSAPLDLTSDAAVKSPAAIFWLILHGLCCLISLVLGFRFSRVVFFFMFSTSVTNFYTAPFRSSSITANELPARTLDVHSTMKMDYTVINRTRPNSRVVVGRHGIRIRPWPHPNPVEVMKAHQIIERVQMEQRLQFGVKNHGKVIVVTPTYVRTFQTVHLTGVMHSLMLVPYELVWIVVEAGEVTKETASVIAKSGLTTIHIGFDQRMSNSWEDRHKLEAKMRLRALRVVKEKKLDGIVMFADDSNMHSMELFDEIQKVKWFGALSVGILARSSKVDGSSLSTGQKDDNPSMPVQGPACNSTNNLVGWHTFNSLPYTGKSAVYIGDRETVLPKKLEWCGFVLNSRLLWDEAKDKPDWVKDLDKVDADDNLESPLSLLKDPSVVEPLGRCGRDIFLWWLRVEARADSKFPSGWIIDPPLEITVPSKRTPWPDTPPELSSHVKMVSLTENNQHTAVPHTKKTRSSSKSKHRSKKKHEATTTNVHTRVTAKHSEPKSGT